MSKSKLRLQPDVNSNDCDHCFHVLIQSHETMKTWCHDYAEFTLDKQFIIGECRAKYPTSLQHDQFDLTVSYRTLLLSGTGSENIILSFLCCMHTLTIQSCVAQSFAI